MTSQTIPDREDRLARAALTYLAEPGDPVLAALVGACSPAEVLTAIRGGLPGGGDLPVPGHLGSRHRVTRSVRRWRTRLADLPPDGKLAALADGSNGIRLVCPGDPEWPGCLDEMDPAPYALWVRGAGRLGEAADRAVAVVGSRACTGYGAHVAEAVSRDLAQDGHAVVSGAAYGIDAAAHRGALRGGGVTVAVLASGVDRPYPYGHDQLLRQIAAEGVIVSEVPLGNQPTRVRFLIRNTLIAALGRGTVVVEAGRRSGALTTDRHAAALGRPVMAIPGPVTSEQSAGCHQLIRNGAHLVRDADDITQVLGR